MPPKHPTYRISSPLFRSPAACVRTACILLAALSAGGLVTGCSFFEDTDATPSALGTEAEATTDTTAVLVNGRAIGWSALQPLLAEAAGAEVLDEVALDAALRQEAARRGVRITAADVQREETLLAQALTAEVGLSENGGARAIERVRRARRLGDARYAALLERTALMRALVQNEVSVSDAEVALAHRVRSGERRRVRIINTPSQREAATLRQRIIADPRSASVAFVEAASTGGVTDPSAVRGGLLGEISSEDPAYPAVLRQSIAQLGPGEVTPVLALERGFGIALVEAVLPPTNEPLDSAKDTLAEDLRRRKERVAMQRLAERMRASADVRPLDRSLGWAYER